MANLKTIATGIFMLIVMNLFFYLAHFMFTGLMGMINVEPVLNAIAWGSLIIVYLLTAVVSPINLIVVGARESEAHTDVVHIAMGVVFYFIGTIISLLIWQLANVIIPAMEGVFSASGYALGYLSQVAWLAVITGYAMFGIVKPIFMIAEGYGLMGTEK